MDIERERASGLGEGSRVRLTGVYLRVGSPERVEERTNGKRETVPLERFLQAGEICHGERRLSTCPEEDSAAGKIAVVRMGARHCVEEVERGAPRARAFLLRHLFMQENMHGHEVDAEGAFHPVCLGEGGLDETCGSRRSPAELEQQPVAASLHMCDCRRIDRPLNVDHTKELLRRSHRPSGGAPCASGDVRPSILRSALPFFDQPGEDDHFGRAGPR